LVVQVVVVVTCWLKGLTNNVCQGLGGHAVATTTDAAALASTSDKSKSFTLLIHFLVASFLSHLLH
jgi:hypothetical protein